MNKQENNIIYSNKIEFEKKLENFKKDWVEKMHILTDFDRTLTKAFVDWKSRPSLISVLRSEKILWEEYSRKAYEEYNFFHPIEIDINISLEEKKKQMTLWWEKHFNLLIESKLKKDDIDRVINSWILFLRDWVWSFLNFTNKNNIPIIIISANALWWDSISDYLKNKLLKLNNISIISNKFIWDKNRVAIGYEKPVIHVFNKDETVLEKFPEIHKKIEKRKNVLLLWDSLWDLHMIDWFNYNNLIKIWFLNEIPHPNPLLWEERGQKDLELLEVYKENYDIVITWDWNFDIVNKIMKEIK